MKPERIVMRVVEATGKIVETPLSAADLQLNWKRSVCPYCGVGCGLLVGSKEGRVIKTRGNPNHPANWGLICGKGATLAQMLDTPDRLQAPLMRPHRQAAFERVSWEKALSRIAAHWKETIASHGPDAVSFYVSGQLLTEDYYVVNKLAKGFLGTNNVDSNSRLCMASAVSGYMTSLGADAPPGCYADIELADCFFLIGTNAAACHPVTFERIRKRRLKAGPRVRLIVVDPRRTSTAEAADLYLAIRPGSDVALLNAMLYVLLHESLIDLEYIRRSTRGWEDLVRVIEDYSPQRCAAICGLWPDQIVEAARLFGRAKAAMSFWAMGLNQSSQGTAKNNALINLHLATQQIGRAGTGPFSLTGQPNAMGGRETGALAGLLPGHRAVANEAHRREMEALWGIPEGRIAPAPGLDAVSLFSALAEGRVKSVWVMATNPMVSMPHLAKVRAALEKAELIVVSDAYHPTETTQYADIVLPVAQWSEREGTLTNSERAVSHLEAVAAPPGEALPDWQIVCRFAEAMGVGEAFPYRCTEEIFEEFKRTTAGRDLDMSGITYQRLRSETLQWPCPSPHHRSGMRRYTDGVFAHPDGKARFMAHPYTEAAEMPDEAFPLILTTGRIRDQWHTMTRTGKIPVLLKREPKPFIEVHPEDAQRFSLREDQLIHVISRRGRASASCRISERIRSGTCFMPFHWGSLWTSHQTTNEPTSEAVDALSKQPELKFCAVRLEPAQKES